MIEADQRQPTGPERRRISITADPPQVIVGAVLILIGLLWTAERADWIDLSATAVLALATLVVGISLMIRSRDGRHPALIIAGAILAAVTMLTAAAPLEGFQGGIGDRTIEVTNTADLETDYELGAGSLVIDLSELSWVGDLGTVTANVGLGELVIRLPSEANVEVRARSAAGDVAIFGEVSDGLFVDRTVRSPGFDETGPRVTIEANVFMGSVKVSDE